MHITTVWDSARLPLQIQGNPAIPLSSRSKKGLEIIHQHTRALGEVKDSLLAFPQHIVQPESRDRKSLHTLQVKRKQPGPPPLAGQRFGE